MALICTLLLPLTAQAQSGNNSPQVTQSVVAGGAGTSSAATRQVEGTAGQGTTSTSSGGTFSISSGFWSAAAPPATTIVVSDVSGAYGGTVTLSATLSSNGASISNKPITFTLNGADVGTAITDTNGVATLAGVSLSGINAGTYSGAITARFDSDLVFAASLASAQLAISKATPLVQVTGGTFTYDGQPHAAAASATGVNSEALSPLSILYDGSSSIPINAGTYAITASFAGNQNYSPAVNSLQSIIITKSNQTITFNPLPNKTFGDAAFTLSAMGGASANAVSFSSQTPTACLVNSNTVTILSAGSCTIRASQAGDGNYDAAAEVDRTFNIAKAASTASVSVVNAVFDGNPHGATAVVNGAGGLNQSLTVTYSGRNGTIYGPATVVPVNAGEYTGSASYAGDADHHSSSDSKDFAIAKAAQAIVFSAVSDQIFGVPDVAVSALASSNLPVSLTAIGQCTVSGSTIHISGAGSCTITASQPGDRNYNPAADVTRSFQIGKAAQTITFDPLENKSFGDADFAVNASSSSGLSVSLTAVGQCTLAGSTVHLNGGGSCTVIAVQIGDANYNPANDVTRSFQIGKAAQTITLDPLANRTFGDPDLTVNATASSGLSVSLTVTGQCSLSGATLHLNGAGTCTITGAQPGNSDYQAASGVTRSFNIAKASTTTVLSASTNAPTPGQSVTLTARVNSAAGAPGGSITFKADGNELSSCANLSLNVGQAICSISALTIGSHTLSAEYSGDTNFSASAGTLTNIETLTGVFDFSQPVYAVGERDGFITITVRRAGDLSSAASIDYTTDDGSFPSVAVPCSAVTGLALERCDYTRAEGTLRFAAGETEKSFTVLINDDSYVEGPETLSLKLMNPSGTSSVGTQAVATLTITDDSVESPINPVDDAKGFVRQHYHDFLNREPDTQGFQFWTDNINSCGADAGCVLQKRIDTSAAFFLSIEFQQTGFLVERFYKTAYGDATAFATLPSPHQLTVPVVQLREFLRDTQEISQGVIVRQSGWERQLESNKDRFALDFVSRPRFDTAYPLSLTAHQFVAQLNTNAGSVLGESEMTQLESIFGGGDLSAADTTRRAQVLRLLAENPDLQQRELNRAFMLMQYFGYLRRNPNDATDTDYTGYDFWLRKLEQFGGDYRRAEMIRAFTNATEYRQRFFHSAGSNQ